MSKTLDVNIFQRMRNAGNAMTHGRIQESIAILLLFSGTYRHLSEKSDVTQ